MVTKGGFGPPLLQGSGQIGLSLITDGVIEMTLITGRQVSFVSVGVLSAVFCLFLILTRLSPRWNGAVSSGLVPTPQNRSLLSGNGDICHLRWRFLSQQSFLFSVRQSRPTWFHPSGGSDPGAVRDHSLGGVLVLSCLLRLRPVCSQVSNGKWHNS